MKKIESIGIVGAGTMGSALAQKFAQEGFEVILADKQLNFVDAGIKRIKSTLDEGVTKRIFSSEQAEETLKRICTTIELEQLGKCGLIIEAIFEDFDAKADLFETLSACVKSDAVLATNTSSFSVSELSTHVSNPERFIGLHYFYHAAKNRLVEIIPGNETSEDTIKLAEEFSSLAGKDAIICKDSYGFVVNRFFVPWLNEAVRLYEEGIASPSEIDAICMKTFSIGMGPFALMNATGVPIAYHAETTLERFGELYNVAELLKRQTELKQNWNIGEAELSNIDKSVRKIVDERMLGIVFLVCSQILDEKVCSAVDINRGARIGLAWRKGPIDLMKKMGKPEVAGLIGLMADKYHTKNPSSVDEKYWQMDYVKLSKFKDTALITILRPEDMNSLNEQIMMQLSEKFEAANSDASIKRIVLTGSGKAFVAGADIKFFTDNIKSNSLDKIVSFTKFGQELYERIDKSSKLVVAIVNGLALGGGLELALCADTIIAVPKSVFAFPETGIGIYPGLGGTQRTQRKIGAGLTKYLIYTGDFLSAAEAKKIGLVDEIIQPDEIPDVISGIKQIQHSDKKELDEKYSSLAHFFEKYPVSDIIVGAKADEYSSSFISDKLIGRIKRKAPVAIKTAEKLINEARGCESELEELTNIFSTSDALLGLSSIGKPVEFQGK